MCYLGVFSRDNAGELEKNGQIVIVVLDLNNYYSNAVAVRISNSS